ncbi:MAG TPA: SHOCT domain-containing protein [Solirubrobacterales bacterium]|nr:SHOCT domain-containing protein [Solirubrobacterales bacterium]
MLVAEFTLGDALLTVVEIFLFVLYFWILITIFGDLFRDHQLSGWAKAGWVLILFLVPFLGMLIYLIARGEGMRERAVREQADMRRNMDEYVRETAGSASSVDELAKLSELKDKGSISDEEFERAKAKLLA